MKGDSEYAKGFYHGLKRSSELIKWMMLDVGTPDSVQDFPDEGPNEEEEFGV